MRICISEMTMSGEVDAARAMASWRKTKLLYHMPEAMVEALRVTALDRSPSWQRPGAHPSLVFLCATCQRIQMIRRSSAACSFIPLIDQDTAPAG